MKTPPAGADRLDEALLAIPYGEWTPMAEAARRLREAGLPGDLLTTVVRRGRRRGALRTYRQAEGTHVMRVHHEPHRPAAPAS